MSAARPETIIKPVIEQAIEAELERIRARLENDAPTQYLSVYTSGVLRGGFIQPIGSENHPLMHGLYFVDYEVSEPAYAVLWSKDHGLALYRATPPELLLKNTETRGFSVRGFEDTDWQPVETEVDKYKILQIVQAIPCPEAEVLEPAE